MQTNDQPSPQCKEHIVGLFSASLVSQPWMKHRSHIPATLCVCGRVYYSWSQRAWFSAEESSEITQGDVS